MKIHKNLVEMRQGEEGTVVGIQGGITLKKRLDAMCITPGANLLKISNSFLRGPVTVQIGNGRMALGFGMASKIILEIEGGDTQ